MVGNTIGVAFISSLIARNPTLSLGLWISPYGLVELCFNS